MLDWEELKQNPDKLLDAVDEYGVRGLARRLDITHPAVVYHLNKLDEKSESKEKKTEEKQGQEERKANAIIDGDTYIITNASNSRGFNILKERVKQIRRDYCAKDHLTINQICRKYKIARWKFMLMKSAFGFTHDDVPYTDEEMYSNDPADLAEEELQRRKDQYFKKLREKELDNALKQLNKYRKKEYFIDKIQSSVLDHFKDFISNYKVPKITKNKHTGNKMLEIPIVDLHLAKLSWEPETGENYDRKIAMNLFMKVVEDILARVDWQEIEKVLFVFGNDYFNFDDIEGETTLGTHQDNDSRWQKMFNTGVELAIRGIDKCRQVAPTEVILVPGNHDWTRSFYAVQYLSAWYRQADDVLIDNSPKSRKYIRYGNSLIGFTHTDKEKRRIFGCMQVEARKDWGETKYHEWHGGHLHSEQVKEDMGVVVRKLPSITAKDAWHYERGYQAQARNQCFVWDKENGLENILVTNVK